MDNLPPIVITISPSDLGIQNGGICDFCSDPSPIWIYPTEEYVMSSVIQGEVRRDFISDTQWFACEPCAEMIESNDDPGLVIRCINQQRAAGQEIGPSEILTICVTHEGFWSHRTNEPRRPFG